MPDTQARVRPGGTIPTELSDATTQLLVVPTGDQLKFYAIGLMFKTEYPIIATAPTAGALRRTSPSTRSTSGHR